MGVVAGVLAHRPRPGAHRAAAILQVAALALLVCAGLATFAALALAFGIADWRDLLGRLRAATGLTGAAVER